MEAPTFLSVIKEATEEIDNGYATRSSVRKIIEKFDSIPEEEQKEYDGRIFMMHRIVDRFQKDDERLTRDQHIGIHGILESSKFLIEHKKTTYCVKDNPHKPIDEPINHKTAYDMYGNIINGCLKLKDDYLNLMNGHPNLNVQKLEQGDVFAELLFTLLTQLESNFGSGLTTPIDNYFNSVDFFTEHDSSKYEPIKKEINECLENHSWKFKNEHTAGGFHSQPTKDKLVNDMRVIVYKYCV